MTESIKLEKVSLREEIKNILADAIMNGEIKQGERLVESKIAKKYGVSQAPVRDAINDLEQMGIVIRVPYKGAYVKEISEQDLKNVYQVRTALEELAIKLTLPNLSLDKISILEEIYEQMQQASGKDDVKAQILLDMKFHEFIVNSSGNDILIKSWRDLCLPYWTFFGTHLSQMDKIEIATRHKPLIQAFKNKDENTAVNLMKEHLQFYISKG